MKSRELLNNQALIRKEKEKLIKKDFLAIEDINNNEKKIIKSENFNMAEIPKLEKFFELKNEKFLQELKSTIPAKKDFVKIEYSIYEKNRDKDLIMIDHEKKSDFSFFI